MMAEGVTGRQTLFTKLERFPNCAVQQVIVIRQSLVDDIISVVFSAEGCRSNTGKHWEKLSRGRAKTPSDDAHGVVEACVKLIGVEASTPGRGSVLGGTVNKSQGRST